MDWTQIILSVIGAGGLSYVIKEIFTMKSSQKKALAEAQTAKTMAKKDEFDVLLHKTKIDSEMQDIIQERIVRYETRISDLIKLLNEKNKAQIEQSELMQSIRIQLNEYQENINEQKNEFEKKNGEISDLKIAMNDLENKLTTIRNYICVCDACKNRQRDFLYLMNKRP